MHGGSLSHRKVQSIGLFSKTGVAEVSAAKFGACAPDFTDYRRCPAPGKLYPEDRRDLHTAHFLERVRYLRWVYLLLINGGPCLQVRTDRHHLLMTIMESKNYLSFQDHLKRSYSFLPRPCGTYRLYPHNG